MKHDADDPKPGESPAFGDHDFSSFYLGSPGRQAENPEQSHFGELERALEAVRETDLGSDDDDEEKKASSSDTDEHDKKNKKKKAAVGGSASKRSSTASSNREQDEDEINRNELQVQSQKCLDILQDTYGTARGFTDPSSVVLVMEGWNKVLAFSTMFSEALYGRWRILVAREALAEQARQKKEEKRRFSVVAAAVPDVATTTTNQPTTRRLGTKQRLSQSLSSETDAKEEEAEDGIDMAKLHAEACDQVERGKDPIAHALGTRVYHGRQLLLGLLDAAVRSTCPHRQTVQREAYSPINDVLKGSPSGFWGMRRFTPEGEGTVDEYFKIFARCGVRPNNWLQFCRAYLWTMKTHCPYAEEDDMEDLESGNGDNVMDSAHALFIATLVAKPAIEAIVKLPATFDTPLYLVSVPRFWDRITTGGTAEGQMAIGEAFYRQLLGNHEEILDYFANADMDSLALHLSQALDLMIKSMSKFGDASSSWRGILDHLNYYHRKLGIPTWAFGIVGSQLLDTLQPLFEAEEEATKEETVKTKAEELKEAFATLYVELMVMIYHAMLYEEKMLEEAEDFIKKVAEELNWPSDKLSLRLLEVKQEIRASCTYTHTSEEIETGARLAWRNSSKCIGRIAWNTLAVRDCRHIESFDGVIEEVKEHLKLATGGTCIQSVMSVFKPKSPDEMWGMRFWSAQFVRYAGYKDEETGEVLGDPANAEFTSYLMKNDLWTPPKERTAFDVLPLVVKIPGIHRPQVYQLPKEYVHAVNIEHPDCPKIKDLGIRWAAVPAISNFNMNLGGVDYQCMPFNGWFVSVEVVRNLFERYKLAKPWAEAMGMSTEVKRIYEQRAFQEMDIAVNHSFAAQGFSMVDMETVGQSFMVHCKRERDAGRECPGQWSWIGGLTGPTNVTWHHEMRDFYIAPQYEYCCEQWMVTEMTDADGNKKLIADGQLSDSEDDLSNKGGVQGPRVLIAFGSETGTAEAAAFQLARSLKLCKPIVRSLNDIAGLDIVLDMAITHFLALTSTFGKGEFPSNAARFASTDIPPGLLENTKVAVLALGSSLYPDYCRAGLQLDRMLSKAGGQPLVPLTKVDDASGSSGPIGNWIGLIERLVCPANLQKYLMSKIGTNTELPRHEIKWLNSDNDTEDVNRFAWPEEETALCCCNEELLGDGDIETRSTRKITFDLPDGITYVAGDHLKVQPLNSLKTVLRLAKCFIDELVPTAGPLKEERLPAQLNRTFKVDCIEDGDTIPAQLAFRTPVTLGDALQAHVDFAQTASTVPALLRLIRRLLSPEGDEKQCRVESVVKHHGFTGRTSVLTRQLFVWFKDVLDTRSDDNEENTNSFIQSYPTVVDFLEEYSPLLCVANISQETKGMPILPLAEFLTLLPRLRPRYYSISSSPREDPTKVSISVGVVHVTTSAGKVIDGVCSNYLARLMPGKDRAKIEVRTASFRGPKRVSSPMILVGAGTGLAPMMGFIQDRYCDIEEKAEEEKVGDSHLFFGCRSQKERIYAPIVDKWVSSGIITQHLALSRESGVPKKYVQNAMKDDGAELYELLINEETHYYICGDAKVGDECFEACVQVLRHHGHMSRVGAVDHIRAMRAQNRWQYDLWGIITHFNETKRKVKHEKTHRSTTWLKSFETS